MSTRGYTLTHRGGESYLVRVSVGKDSATGKYRQVSETIYAKNKTEAHRKAEAFRNRVKLGFSGDISRVTVEEYLDDYFNNTAVQQVKTSTLNGYKAMVRGYVYPRIGSLKMSQLTVAVMDKFFADLYREGGIGQKKKDGTLGKNSRKALSPRTIRQIRNILNKPFEKAVVHNIIQSNPIKGTTTPKIQKADKRALSLSELNALEQYIDTASDRAHAAALAIMLHTGMRRGEVLGLKWQDIMLSDQSGLIRVERSLKKSVGGGTYYDTPKTNSSIRTVPVTPRLLEVLEQYKEYQRNYLAELGVTQTLNTPVILGDDGQVMLPSNLSNKTCKLFKSLNFPEGTNNHTLRHTFISYACAVGVPQTTTMQIVGHSTSQLTADVYTHKTEGAHEQAAIAVGAAFNNARKDLQLASA